MDELRASGSTLPDAGTARRWKEDLERLDRIDLRSVEVRHFLLVPPFTISRMFVVKAVFQDGNGEKRTRCFSLSAESRFFDFFWVSEQASWVWLLPI